MRGVFEVLAVVLLLVLVVWGALSLVGVWPEAWPP